MRTGNQCRAAVGGRDAVVSSTTMKAAPISLSAWANPGADEGECSDDEERPNRRHYLRHSTALPLILPSLTRRCSPPITGGIWHRPPSSGTSTGRVRLPTDLRLHDLRHSGAVLAALTGATLTELMPRLEPSTNAAAMRFSMPSTPMVARSPNR